MVLHTTLPVCIILEKAIIALQKGILVPRVTWLKVGLDLHHIKLYYAKKWIIINIAILHST